MKQKVLLFGSCGMLGQSIKKIFSDKNDIQLFTAARSNADYNFDFCDDNLIAKCFDDILPDVVINTAALVNLDYCEKDKAVAYMINARFVSVLENLCRSKSCYLIHISTDHFYENDIDKKHSENFPLILKNEYARTKFCGEQFALLNDKNLVLRTNIIGLKKSSKTKSFLEWALDCIKNNQEMLLFTDFYTSSIHVSQFSNILYDILHLQPSGVYN